MWCILAALFTVKKPCNYLNLMNLFLEMFVSTPAIEGMQASRSRSLQIMAWEQLSLFL